LGHPVEYFIFKTPANCQTPFKDIMTPNISACRKIIYFNVLYNSLISRQVDLFEVSRPLNYNVILIFVV
jgi:hypothetical protein